MTEHQRDTAFLKRIIRFDNSDERRKIENRIAQVQSDARCVRRVAGCMVLLVALCVSVLAYGTILQHNFSNEFRLLNKVLCVLGLTSLICLVVLTGLLLIYRWKLNGLREECRVLVTTLLESMSGQSDSRPARADYVRASGRAREGRTESRSAAESNSL